MRDFLDLIAQQCQLRADECAVIASDGRLTYHELAVNIDQFADRLAVAGVTKGSLVAICMPRGAIELSTMLAVVALGAAYLPLDPAQPHDRLATILADAQPDVLVTKQGHPIFETDGCETVVINEGSEPQGHRAVPFWEQDADPEALAYVLFTSGSTGRPKGVEVTRGGMSNFLGSMLKTPGLSRIDIVLATATTMFDIAVLELFGPLCVGATVRIADTDVVRDGHRLRDLLERESISVMQATPTAWQMLVECGWVGDGRLRMFVGGEALRPDLARQLLQSGELWNMYGPTETTVWSTCKRIDGPDDITIGRPIDNIQIYVLDDQKRPLPAGVTGELYIGGAGLARGYLGRPDLTAERFIENPAGPPGDRIYRTGDLGRQLSNGEYECLGRIDHQVKIRGFRVELGEIESALGDLDCVSSAVVIKWEPAGGTPILVAYVVPSRGSNFEPRKLSQLLSERLPAYMIPGRYIQMSSFPLTLSRKIDRGALPDPGQAAQSPAHGTSTGPRTETERTVLAAWSEVLGQKHISIDDDFFDLGGQSILAVRVCDEMHRRLRVRLPVSAVVEKRSVAQLAAYIDDLQSGSAWQAWNSVVPIQPTGSLPPIFCVSGNGGNPMTFVSLADGLGEQQPFYGLQHRGVDGMHRPHDSIEAMAQEFLGDIRSVRPNGPYILAGYSAGGLVGYEVAQLLIEVGEDVELLILLDTERPGIAGWSRQERFRAHLDNVKTAGLRYLERRSVDRIQNLAGGIAKRFRATLARLSVYRFRMDAVEIAGERAAAAYVPRKYPGDVLLFQSDPEWNPGRGIRPKQHESNGWSELVGGRLDVVAVNADHRGLIEGDAGRFVASQIADILSSKRLDNGLAQQ